MQARGVAAAILVLALSGAGLSGAVLSGAGSGVSGAQAMKTADAPTVVPVTTHSFATDARVNDLVSSVRQQADAFIFLAGGASKLDDARKRELLALFEAFSLLARDGVRFAVGDGGTQAGIMEASGLARRASQPPFPLIGVSPKRELALDDKTRAEGKTAIDPNHSHIVAVDNPDWDGKNGYWGAETVTMYQLFARLAEGRPSIAIIANGGPIVLEEVKENVKAGRKIILIAGSGRVTDALVSLLPHSGGAPAQSTEQSASASNEQAAAAAEMAGFRASAEKLGLVARPELFEVFDIHAGPQALAARLRAAFAPSK